MSDVTMKALKASADELGVKGFEVHPKYSGRGMYGQTTGAVSFSIWSVFASVLGHAVNVATTERKYITLESITGDMEALRHDQMGKGLIAY